MAEYGWVDLNTSWNHDRRVSLEDQEISYVKQVPKREATRMLGEVGAQLAIKEMDRTGRIGITSEEVFKNSPMSLEERPELDPAPALWEGIERVRKILNLLDDEFLDDTLRTALETELERYRPLDREAASAA